MYIYTVGTESTQTPPNPSLPAPPQPPAKIKKVHSIPHECTPSTPPRQKKTEMQKPLQIH